jgi:spore cortex biosynthesis protein YabQ
MEISYALQHFLFLASLLVGLVCGAVYDIFRLLRAFSLKNRVIVFIEDIIYCLFVALAFMVLFYNYSEGHIRFYAFAGIIAGFSAYYFTIGMLTRKIFTAIRAMIISMASKIKKAAVRSAYRTYGRMYSSSRIRRTSRLAKNGFGF